MQITIPIEKWLEDHGQKEYAACYLALAKHLKPKHTNVVASANYQEYIKTGKIIFLNDHGPDHIRIVTQRAIELINSESCKLNHKEIFYLLVAIQIHDIGNLYGRTGHETEARKLLPDIKPILSVDDVELRYIRQIAEAHGGELAGGNKDKISKLSPVVKTDNIEVKQQLIAAILRFADELAEEKGRCDRNALENNLLPKSSEVFHAYSYCLDCTLIKHELKTIELHFKIPKNLAVKELGKGDGEIYLIDEIFKRVLKMHQERIYVSRFWKSEIDIEKIWVSIEFYASYLDDFVCEPLTFEVKETGYPGIPTEGLMGICPELTKNEQIFDGKYYAEKIKTNG